jgi:Ca-activated chloride channel homolog
MQRKCVYFYLVLSVLALLFFFIAARKTFAANGPATGDTPGALSACDRTGKSLGSCPLVHTDVKAEISGILSRVTVRQQFQNPFKAPIEAVYAFPLPHNAAVDDMTIHAGPRTIRGVIKRREEARAIYERARAQGQLAALLDQERPNIFTQQLANILPGQNVDIVISYTETLKYANGGYSFIFPMTVGPRYIPGWPIGKEGGGWSHDTTRVPDASRITPPVTPPGTRSGHDISIEVSIDSGVLFENLRSAQHELAVLRRDTHSALVQLADRAVIPNKDFILSFDVAASQVQEGVVMHRSAGDGYFMMILQPPRTCKPDQVVPKELVFVLDTSGSMQGFPIEKAKETMAMALAGLYPHDTFNLITFSGDTRILFPRPVPATPAHLELARQMLNGSYGSGGTEMMTAIRAALAPSDEQGHVRIVCFMTDGQVGNDMEIISEVQKHPNARVFSFGIGSEPNRFLLDKIAEEGRGAAEYVTLEGDAAAAAARFHERIRNPLLTDISLEWSGTPVSQIYPRRIPDLFSAEPIVVTGRYSHGGSATVRLRGRNSTVDFVKDLQLYFPEKEFHHEVLAKLWAREKIDALMADDFLGIQNGNPRADIRESITRLGLDYGLMTQFTSFVAVEERIANEGGKSVTVPVPVEMPAGGSYSGVFGVADEALVAPSTIPKAIAVPGKGYGGIMGGVAGGIAGGAPGGVVGNLIAPQATVVLTPPPPPPPKPVMRSPVRVGGNIQESKLILKVDPVYPELAIRARISGKVVLDVTVDEEGNVTDAKVVSGHPLLNEAAVTAVKQWKYAPTLLNGAPVPVSVTTTVDFKLDAPPSLSSNQPRIDPVLSRLIIRLKSGNPVNAAPFVHDGKAEVELQLSSTTDAVRSKLWLLGFEAKSWPAGSAKVVGRIPVGKLESLLDIDAVRYIAPHYK